MDATPAQVRLTALIVATALFMQNLDSTIIATALPAMGRSFHADPLHLSVALTAYLISLSVFIPVSGWLADRFGSRTVFRAAIVVFTLASLLCGIAPSLLFLVLARIVQGIGGAMMVPVGRLVLLRTAPKSQLVNAMAWLTVPALVGPIVGPPLGGLIVTWASWRWVFDINLPVGILGVVMVTLFIPNVREAEDNYQFDVWGFVLTGVAMAALMGGLQAAGHGLIPTSWTLGALLLGVGACLLYIPHARRHPHPILDFSLMRLPTFMVSMLAGSLFRVAVGATPFLLPLMLQLGFGDSALQSGLITFTTAMGAIAIKPLAQPMLRRFGFRTTLIVNGALASAGIAVSALFEPHWPPLVLNAVLLVGGVFRSLQFTAYNTIAYGDVPRPRMSAATSLYSTIQQLTLTLGIVVASGALEAAKILRHQNSVSIGDYHLAFLLVGAIGLLAVPICMRLSKNAGAEISGHHEQGADAAVRPQVSGVSGFAQGASSPAPRRSER